MSQIVDNAATGDDQVRNSDARLETIAQEIESLEATAITQIMQIGKLLAEARDLYRYQRNEGGFTGWVKKRLGFSADTAYNLIRVYEQFGENLPNRFGTLQVTVLSLLGRPSTPESARKEISGRVETGETITKAKTKETIKRHMRSKVSPVAEINQEPSVTQSGGRPHCKDLLFDEFFNQVDGSEIYDRIPAARRADVVRAFLDRLTVPGLYQFASSEFRKQLQAAGSAARNAARSAARVTGRLLADMWHRASSTERMRFLDRIGAQHLRAHIPASWAQTLGPSYAMPTDAEDDAEVPAPPRRMH